MAGYQLPEWIRISVGTPAENARCVAALRDLSFLEFHGAAPRHRGAGRA